MPAREIKTRFKLEGEQEYRRAMTDAANAIKVLNSEEKLAKAQYEATGDAQQYAAEQARILRDQISQQEKAVKAAETAVKELTKNGVDPNAKEMQNWRTKLNNAQTSLTNMKTKLGKVESGLKDTSKEFGKGEDSAGKFDSSLDTVDDSLDDTSDSLDDTKDSANQFDNTLGSIGKTVTLQAAIEAIDNLKTHLEDGIKKMGEYAQKVWEWETDAGKWADDLATAASKAGIDVETYQSWQYASKFIDTETGAITKSINKLAKDLGSKNTEMAETFNSLSVRTRDSAGNVRDSTDIFWEVIDALGRIKDPTERAIRAQKLFGDSWTDLQPLIEAGSGAYKALAEEGRNVAVVSEDNVGKLGALNDAQEKMNATLEKVKYDALAGLAPAFTDISEAVTNAGNALDDFINSEEGQAAIGALNEAITELLNTFLGEDNGKQTFKAIVEGATSAVQGFTDILKWISNNQELVVGAVGAIAAAWAGLTISKEVLTFMQLLNAIPMAKINAMFKGGAAGAAASGMASGLGGKKGTNAENSAVNAAAKAGGGFFAKLLPKLGAIMTSTAAKAAGGVGLAASIVLTPHQNAPDAAEWDELYHDDGSLTKAGQQYENLTPAWFERTAELTRAQREAAEKFWDIYRNNPFEFDDADFEAFEAAFAGNMEAFDRINALMDELVTSYKDSDWTAIEDLPDEWFKIGEDSANGMAEGLTEATETATGAAFDMAMATVDSAKKALDSHSPSRVFEGIGEYASIGLANGILARQGDVTRAAARVARAANDILEAQMDAFDYAVSYMSAAVYRPVMGAGYGAYGGSSGSGSSAGSINATIVMDKTVVGNMVAPVVNSTIGAMVSAERM